MRDVPATDERRSRLNAQIEAAVVRELALTYADINRAYFKNALTPAAIELRDGTSAHGSWLSGARTIALSRDTVMGAPWGSVVEVLKHEMAHQYVDEILRAESEPGHGPTFRSVCERLGIDAAATGLPTPASEAENETKRTLDRIAKLLALAESANVHEAEAAMSAAQRLMLKHNLAEIGLRTPRGYSFRHLGRPTGRVNEHERLMAAILAEHFFVEVIWVPVYRPLEMKHGSVLEVCGTPANLEMAAYVHGFLSSAGEQLWREHKRARKISGNRDRRTYLAGVMAGFLEKLRRQKRAHQEEGLVWVEDGDLGSFFKRRHPHIRHAKYGGTRRTEAHLHGRRAGESLVLHRPVTGHAGSSGKLLLGK